jgi:TP901 family phage tail tape measure protein
MASNKRLNATIIIGGAINGTLKAAFGSVKGKIDEVGAAVSKLKARQAELNRVIREQETLGRAGSALRVQYAQQELADLDKKLAKLRAVQAHERRLADLRAANDKRKADLRGMVGGALVAGATFGIPIAQAVKFETAMLGIAKQVDGARDSAGNLTPVYFDMAKKIQMLGRELPIATNEIANMVTAAARMNIAKEDLVEFTRTAAIMATAFEAPAAELADNMGKIATIFKIPLKDIAELGDAINYLDDNAISKGSDIIKVMQGDLAGAASTMGLSAKNAAALASTFLTLGESAERADTAASGMLRQLQIAKMNPKRFQVGVQMIGLTADQLQKGMIRDPQSMILDVLERIKKLPQEKQMEAVTRLFGKDWGGAIAKLAGGVEEYRRQLELANGEAAKGSMSREFQSRMKTTAAQWDVFKNRITEVGVNIGTVLLPPLNKVMGYFAGITSSIADFTRENPRLVQNVLTVAGAFVAFGAVKMAVLGVAWAFTALRVAVAANPIGLLITLLAAGAMLVYQNWEPIKAFFIDLWGTIKDAAGKTWDWLQGVFFKFHPLGIVIANWQPIKTFFTNLWDDITGTARTALDWIIDKIEAIGRGWQKTKAFFGFGSAPSAGASAAPSLPAVPPMATARGGAASYVDNSQTTFQLTQLPGESTEQLARRISQIQERERAVRQRGAMYDGVN